MAIDGLWVSYHCRLSLHDLCQTFAMLHIHTFIVPIENFLNFHFEQCFTSIHKLDKEFNKHIYHFCYEVDINILA